VWPKRSVAIGKNALNSTAANDSLGQVAIGYNALTALTSGAANTVIGYESGRALTTGGSNISLGYQAHLALVSGDNNVAIGVNAADAMAVGESENIAIGTSALGGMDEGTAGGDIDGNIAIGHAALVGGDLAGNDRQVQDNIAIGRNALNTTSDNAQTGTIAIGKDTLTALTSGTQNTAIGYQAGDGLTTGAENTIVGYNCDVASNDNTNNVIIGNNLTATDKDNAVFIGNDTNHIENDFNADATWNYSSDIRQKTEIEDDTLGLDFINKIRPVVYKHKSPSEFPKEWSSYDENDKEPMGGDKKIHGLIAQEVKEVLDEADVDSFGGWSEGDDGRQRVSREMFITPLIKSVQELSSENERLKDKLNDLEIFIKDKLGDK